MSYFLVFSWGSDDNKNWMIKCMQQFNVLSGMSSKLLADDLHMVRLSLCLPIMRRVDVGFVGFSKHVING